MLTIKQLGAMTSSKFTQKLRYSLIVEHQARISNVTRRKERMLQDPCKRVKDVRILRRRKMNLMVHCRTCATLCLKISPAAKHPPTSTIAAGSSSNSWVITSSIFKFRSSRRAPANLNARCASFKTWSRTSLETTRRLSLGAAIYLQLTTRLAPSSRTESRSATTRFSSLARPITSLLCHSNSPMSPSTSRTRIKARHPTPSAIRSSMTARPRSLIRSCRWSF